MKAQDLSTLVAGGSAVVGDGVGFAHYVDCRRPMSTVNPRLMQDGIVGVQTAARKARVC